MSNLKLNLGDLEGTLVDAANVTFVHAGDFFNESVIGVTLEDGTPTSARVDLDPGVLSQKITEAQEEGQDLDLCDVSRPYAQTNCAFG